MLTGLASRTAAKSCSASTTCAEAFPAAPSDLGARLSFMASICCTATAVRNGCNVSLATCSTYSATSEEDAGSSSASSKSSAKAPTDG